jgi:hypothetical protein
VVSWFLAYRTIPNLTGKKSVFLKETRKPGNQRNQETRKPLLQINKNKKKIFYKK